MADYVTLSEVKNYLAIPNADTADDAVLAVCITAASRAIDVACNQVFVDTVPAAVRMGTLIQAARFFKRKDSPFGIAGSPEMGNETRLLSRLDPDVALLVSTERNWWGAV